MSKAIIVGSMAECKAPKIPRREEEENVLIYKTPFGDLLAYSFIGGMCKWVHAREDIWWNSITISHRRGSASIYFSGLPEVDHQLIKSLVPKPSKPRKPHVICPGLDLRPLQQEYRKRLGDLHRLKANKNLFYGLWPYVTIDLNMEGAERMLKEEYELAKVRAIFKFNKAQKEKENE